MFPRKDDPMAMLVEGMMEPDGLIERSEQRGQDVLVKSDVLPRKYNVGNRQELEQMGVIFGEEADDIFVYVTLPEGWKKESNNHSMWSKLLDDQGRERASIFYKAAFYDRDAHTNILARFNASTIPINGWDDPDYHQKEWIGVVLDGGTKIWQTEPIDPEPKVANDLMVWYSKKDDLVEKARLWLDENYPDWKSRLAYW